MTGKADTHNVGNASKEVFIHSHFDTFILRRFLVGGATSDRISFLNFPKSADRNSPLSLSSSFFVFSDVATPIL